RPHLLAVPPPRPGRPRPGRQRPPPAAGLRQLRPRGPLRPHRNRPVVAGPLLAGHRVPRRGRRPGHAPPPRPGPRHRRPRRPHLGDRPPSPAGGRARLGRNLGPPGGVWIGETESVEGRPLDEQELVEQARGGDARAYEVLVRRYQDLAFRTAWVIAGGADAEDA